MLIKNISVKILGIAGKSILPDETVEIPDSFRENEVLKKWIDMDYIVETIPAVNKAPKKAVEQPVVVSEEVSKPSDDEIKAATKKAELLALAGKYGIEVSSSMTVSELRAALK